MLRAALADDGVDLSLAESHRRADDPGHRRARRERDRHVPVPHGRDVAPRAVGSRRSARRSPTRPAAFHLGTLGLVLEPMATALAEGLAGVATGDARHARSELPAAGHPRSRRLPRRDCIRLLRRADVVKVSRDDLDLLWPGMPAAVAAQRIARAPVPAAVLVTDGPIAAVGASPALDVRARRSHRSTSSTRSGRATPSAARSSPAGSSAGSVARSWSTRTAMRDAVGLAIEVAGADLRRPGADPAAPARGRLAASRDAVDAGRAGAGPPEHGAIMATMATETDRRVVPAADRAPSSWGLGDGQAIPWEYAPAPEARDIVTLKERYGLFIDGREVRRVRRRHLRHGQPGHGADARRTSRKATAADVDKAVRRPRRAQTRRWGNLSGKERAKYLFRIARILQERIARVRGARVDGLRQADQGEPRRRRAARGGPLLVLRRLGRQARLRVPGPRRPAARRRRPDHPVELPAAHAVLEDRPGARRRQHGRPEAGLHDAALSALLFADVCRQADLPPGVVNIVTGPGEIGMSLVTHPGVDKVAFTGSTEIGKQIARGVAGTDKALTLELGGKAANIVFDDAPLDQAVEGIVNGIYFNQGEVCCAGSRLLAQESIVEPLIDKLKDRLATIRVGDPLDKNTDVGAINSKSQLEKITELVASGVAEGAELYQPACDLPERGYFFRPTLFTNVAQSHRIAREEIFGPVLSVLTFRTPDEAVEKANNTVYGLSAGIWTDKGSRILEMVGRMKAGVVWANTFNRFDPTSPFGGYKESGFGREGGMHGLHAYVRLEDR